VSITSISSMNTSIQNMRLVQEMCSRDGSDGRFDERGNLIPKPYKPPRKKCKKERR
jgi:hypothetical protein